MAQNPEIYLYEMMRDEFGIDPRVAEETSLRPAFSMGASYALGSLIPVLPYLVTGSHLIAQVAGLACAVIGLFAIGFYAARVSDRNPWLKGLEIVAFGTAVFGVSYAAGNFIPPLFGHAPVPLGG